MKANDNEIWVFLSHSNEDYERVRIVRNYLEEKSFRPIMFYLKCLNDDDEVNELIKREIDSRNRFVLCDSKNARVSRWVKTEVDYIKSKERMYHVINLEKDLKNIKKQIDSFIFRSSIFISYTHHDAILAKRIMKELKKNDFRIINNDFLSEQNLFTSGSFVESIKDNIEEASNNGYVIILLSKHSIQSSWVLHETQFALKLSKKRDNIFPVVIDKEIWKWDKIINYLRLPNEVTEREVLALDMSNYKIKDIPSIIANKLLNIDYDYYIKSSKIIK